jgi:hypothetical protein
MQLGAYHGGWYPAAGPGVDPWGLPAAQPPTKRCKHSSSQFAWPRAPTTAHMQPSHQRLTLLPCTPCRSSLHSCSTCHHPLPGGWRVEGWPRPHSMPPARPPPLADGSSDSGDGNATDSDHEPLPPPPGPHVGPAFGFDYSTLAAPGGYEQSEREQEQLPQAPAQPQQPAGAAGQRPPDEGQEAPFVPQVIVPARLAGHQPQTQRQHQVGWADGRAG